MQEITPSGFLTMVNMGFCTSGNLTGSSLITRSLRDLMIPNPAIGSSRYELVVGGHFEFPVGDLGVRLTSFLDELENRIDLGWQLIDVLRILYLRTSPIEDDPEENNLRVFIREAFDGIFSWLVFRSQNLCVSDTPH